MTLPNAGTLKRQVPRVPDTVDPRLRRSLELLAQVHNSLAKRGQLLLVDPDTNSWAVVSDFAAGGMEPQAANVVFAGPAAGGDAAPGFRVLVRADLPAAERESHDAENKEGAAISTGMAVAVHSSGTGAVKADATAAGKPTVGVCSTGNADGQTVVVDTAGTLALADWSGVLESGAGALAGGSRYYVSASAPGKLTATAPTTSGQYVDPVGRAIDTTTLVIEPGPRVLL